MLGVLIYLGYRKMRKRIAYDLTCEEGRSYSRDVDSGSLERIVGLQAKLRASEVALVWRRGGLRSLHT